jgi:hypothetical protein
MEGCSRHTAGWRLAKSRLLSTPLPSPSASFTCIPSKMAMAESTVSFQAIVDMPDRLIDLFIRLSVQNKGVLSAAKRNSHFAILKDEEVTQMQQAIKGSRWMTGCRAGFSRTAKSAGEIETRTG